MKNRFSLYATFLTLALSSPLAFAEENAPSHNHVHPQTEAGKPPSAQEEAMKVDIRKYMQKMQDTMLAMHSLAHKIEREKNPKNLEKLKKEHIILMGKHMEMMIPFMMQMMMESHGANGGMEDNAPAQQNPHNHAPDAQK
ncbi:MAG: hypothetical protein IDH49_09430 [Gammaproteobacteria bacterium]|nr:hypothetical protein [Gammaproteobacteria bacterium]